MKLMVPRWTLTWIEVDIAEEEVGPARVFNLPENVLAAPEPETWHNVQGVDPHLDHLLSKKQKKLASKLVDDGHGYEFVMEERGFYPVRRKEPTIPLFASGQPNLAREIER